MVFAKLSSQYETPSLYLSPSHSSRYGRGNRETGEGSGERRAGREETEEGRGERRERRKEREEGRGEGGMGRRRRSRFMRSEAMHARPYDVTAK